MPHAQVSAGQYFEVEWMTDHGDYTYFVILHSNYSDKMNLHTPELLEDYIASAPNGTINEALDPMLQRFHRKDTNGLSNDRPDITIPNFFSEIINSGDSRYIYRPPIFGGQIGNIINPTDSNTTYLLTYPMELFLICCFHSKHLC